MNRSARLLAMRLSAIVLCFHAVAAPGCSHRFYWQGPSDWFNVLDLNEDGLISRVEAEFSDPRTMLSFQFPFMLNSMHEDCDNDGVITWKEYHGNRWGGERCAWTENRLTAVLAGIGGLPEYHTALTPRLVDDPARFASVGSDGTYDIDRASRIVRNEYQAMMASRVVDRVEIMEAHLSPPSVLLACDGLTVDSEGITRYWLNQAGVDRDGVGPLQRCEIRNELQQRSVAAATVRVTTVVSGADITTLHEKAMVVEPRSADSFYVLHQVGAREADIELIAVKYFSE